MSDLRLFIPISKIDEEKRLVYGVLTQEICDKSGEIFDYATGKPAVQAWSDEIKEASKGKSLGNVRAMHGNAAAGKFTDIIYDDANKRIEGAAKIVDDDEWAKCREGVYSGFSIGGAYTKRWQDPDNPSLWRFTPKLSEISLVDNPCVPTATFEYVKADGSVEMRKFTPSHKEDSMDPKVLAAAKDALAKGTASEEQKALVAKADADVLLKAAQDADAKGEATDEQKALLAKSAADAPALVKDGKAVKPKAAPVQKWLADDGTPFDSKREAEVHNLHLEKQAELAPGLAQMDALLKGAKKPVEDDDEDKDGDDEETKKAKKSRRDEKAAKAKAEKDDAEMAAKAKEKEEAEKAAAAAQLAKTAPAKAAPMKKGLGQIGWLANLLSELQCIQGGVEFEQMWEGDTGSVLPEKFKGLVSEMCQVLIALVDEETKELIEGDDTDVEILAMAAGLPKEHAAALGKRVGEMKPYEEADLKKAGVKANIAKLIALKDALTKAGARHSKADMEKFGEMHKMVKDHADALGKMADDHADAMGKCMKEAGMIPEGDDGEPDMDAPSKNAKKMSKLIDALEAERDGKEALVKVVAQTNESLLKAIPIIEGLQKQVSDLQQEKLDIAKRMEHLEGQPLPAKGHVRAVSKTQDGGAAGETDAEYKARLAKLTPTARGRELMKLAMSNPMELPAL